MKFSLFEIDPQSLVDLLNQEDDCVTRESVQYCYFGEAFRTRNFNYIEHHLSDLVNAIQSVIPEFLITRVDDWLVKRCSLFHLFFWLKMSNVNMLFPPYLDIWANVLDGHARDMTDVDEALTTCVTQLVDRALLNCDHNMVQVITQFLVERQGER